MSKAIANRTDDELNKNNINAVEIILPFFVLLAQYSFAGITAAQIAMLVGSLVVLANKKLSLFFPKEFRFFLIFFAFVILLDCGKMLIGDSSSLSQLNRILGYSILFVSMFIVCSVPFCEKRLFAVWKVAVVLFSAGLFFHLLQINVLHQPVEPISLLPNYSLRTDGFLSTTRPTSLFREPSMFAAAIIPFLFLCLKRHEYRWAVFTSFLLLISTSTVGIVVCILLWLFFVLRSEIQTKYKAYVVVALILGFSIFAYAPLFQDSFQKFLTVSQGGGTFTSRIGVGFEIIGRMTPSELIFGASSSDPMLYIGANYSSFSQTSALYYLENGNLFMNTVSQLIFRYGLIGVALFLACYVSLLKQKEYQAKDFVIVYLAIIFFETALLNSYYFYYAIILLSYVTISSPSSVRKRAGKQ